MINKYLKRSHISERKFKEIIRYFREDINATIALKLSNANRSTINKIYLELHKIIARYCEENSIFLQ